MAANDNKNEKSATTTTTTTTTSCTNNKNDEEDHDDDYDVVHHHQHQQQYMMIDKKQQQNNNNNDNLLLNSDGIVLQCRLYNQRWIQLGYLSLLALMSDWICFSLAAAPEKFEEYYNVSSASNLIDLFLFVNVMSSFCVPDIVSKYGMKTTIRTASIIMTVGCWFRCGITWISIPTTTLLSSTILGSSGSSRNGIDTSEGASSSRRMSGFGFLHHHDDIEKNDDLENNNDVDADIDDTTTTLLVPYYCVLIGTIFVGISQPFFQCTPPLLSAQWFGCNERATSTSIALNFNQIGIAFAFVVGGSMTTSIVGIQYYFIMIAIICTMVTIGVYIQFQDRPILPPSTSELQKRLLCCSHHREEEEPFIRSIQHFFSTPGFTKPLIAFICSISITNIVGAFIDEVMERGGITNKLHVSIAGALFELAIVIGGIMIGGYVDRTKQYKRITLLCLLISMITLLPLGFTEHKLGKEPILLVISLICLGFVAGPIQPINAELAVDIIYPGNEIAVESIQQIGGNLISAILVPIAERASRFDYVIFKDKNNNNNHDQNHHFIPSSSSFFECDIRGDVIVLLLLTLITYFYFATFNAPLQRTIADDNKHKNQKNHIHHNNNNEQNSNNNSDNVNDHDDDDDDDEQQQQEKRLLSQSSTFTIHPNDGDIEMPEQQKHHHDQQHQQQRKQQQQRTNDMSNHNKNNTTAAEIDLVHDCNDDDDEMEQLLVVALSSSSSS